MENQALDIIEMLYTMIAEAWGVPLSGEKCLVERDRALNLLDDLKAQLPVELNEAKRLVGARDEFVGSAKKEADAIRRTAEEQARTMLDKQEIVIAAKKEAEELVRAAEEKCRELRRVAGEYLDDAMRQTEESVALALEAVRRSRAQFRAVSNPAPEASVGVTLDDVDRMDPLS